LPEIPESLLRRSAEAKAKALGVPVEQVLAEMKGEGPPVEAPSTVAEDVADATAEAGAQAGATAGETPPPEESPAAMVAASSADAEDVGVSDETSDQGSADAEDVGVSDETSDQGSAGAEDVGVSDETPGEEAAEEEAIPAAVATATPDEAVEEEVEEEPIPAVDIAETEVPSGNGSGNGKVAAVVSPRPSVPPAGIPEGVRTQRLLTVVKARAIQNVKAEPHDKVNTWPHLMLMEFGALLAITGFLVILAVIIHSPLLDPANFNQTPNPSKAPWYFLGLQELLSYFDPQIAGVMVPTFTGLIGFMMIPYVDKNPSTRPSDRKFAILLYSIFLAGAATLTIFGVLFRGHGFNFSYPWKDGVFFDDLKDWVQFE
jgi:menaquinol-cytochrome c reductase cytochrome b/c subunit